METATVLSHRKGQSLVRIFLEEVIKTGGFPVIYITEELQGEALPIFLNQTKKGTSVTDCVNVAVARQFHISEVFSFDKAYSKQFGMKLASE